MEKTLKPKTQSIWCTPSLQLKQEFLALKNTEDAGKKKNDEKQQIKLIDYKYYCEAQIKRKTL